MPNASSWSASSPLLLLWEDSSGTRILLSLLYAALAISGTLSNVMVIYLVFSFKKLQTTSNAFIVNGCAADLSVCALWMPQEAVLGLLPPNSSSLRSAEYRLLRGGLLGLGLTVSLASHLLVAFNRYVLITKLPSVYQALYQRRHTGCMIGLSWVLALLLLPLLVINANMLQARAVSILISAETDDVVEVQCRSQTHTCRVFGPQPLRPVPWRRLGTSEALNLAREPRQELWEPPGWGTADSRS
nr:PREDICTED: probable G-protein coupled receptor 88 [Apteryx mantelli mantelli]